MMKTIFFLLLAVGLSVQNFAQFEEKCKDGKCLISAPFSSSNSSQKRYYVGLFFKANWFKAAHYCRFHGMQLATVNSQQEQNVLEKLLKDNGIGAERFWVSGIDKGSEGFFFWMSTGRPVKYTNWHSGQPDNARAPNGETEDCMELWNIKNSGFFWNDLYCSYESFFVCETLSSDE